MKLPLSTNDQINARIQALAHAADLVKNARNFDPTTQLDVLREAGRFYAFLTDDGAPQAEKAEAPSETIAVDPVHYVRVVEHIVGGAMVREDEMVKTLRLVGYAVHYARPDR